MLRPSILEYYHDQPTGKNKDWDQVVAKWMQYYPCILFVSSYSYIVKLEGTFNCYLIFIQLLFNDN